MRDLLWDGPLDGLIQIISGALSAYLTQHVPCVPCAPCAPCAPCIPCVPCALFALFALICAIICLLICAIYVRQILCVIIYVKVLQEIDAQLLCFKLVFNDAQVTYERFPPYVIFQVILPLPLHDELNLSQEFQYEVFPHTFNVLLLSQAQNEAKLPFHAFMCASKMFFNMLQGDVLIFVPKLSSFRHFLLYFLLIYELKRFQPFSTFHDSRLVYDPLLWQVPSTPF